MTSDLPTPEQRESTARRYCGQRALVAAEVVQAAPSSPTAPPVAERPTGGFRRAFWLSARWVTFWTLMGLILAAIGGRQVPGPHFNATGNTIPAYPTFYPLAHPATVILAVALGVLVVFWLLVAMGAYLRLVWQTTGEAMKPVPSLAEIEVELRQAGYDPSIADLVAVHQHLTSQRNEAAIIAGALVIGPQLLAQQAKGEPLL